MERDRYEKSTCLNLFDIVATTANGIAAPVIGADDMVDGETDRATPNPCSIPPTTIWQTFERLPDCSLVLVDPQQFRFVLRQR